MAFVDTTGQVENLKLSNDFGFVNIRRDPPDGGNELLIIWFGDQSQGPAALFTTELSMALARGLHVRLTHEEDGAFITLLQVDAATP
ncbi:MAG: hypothetical protein EHM33_27910 [Chloroflexi bacterium]|nr:MAG: hypothetical protein EHM33_27910 [Chloroflexota bacterium]